MQHVNVLDSNHIKSLESLRGLAAISVFFGHMYLINHAYDDILKPWLFMCAGHEAVILFFILSAFVLTRAYNNKQEIFKNYAIKRLFRIYPAYYGSLIVSAGLFLILQPVPILQYSIWFNSNFSAIQLSREVLFNAILLVTKSENQINGVAWSLTYEIIISVIILPFFWKSKTKHFIILLFYIAYFVLKQYINFTNFNCSLCAVLSASISYSIFFYVGFLLATYQDRLMIFSQTWLIPCYIFLYASLFFTSNHELFKNHFIRDILTGLGSVGFIILALYHPTTIKFLKNRILNFYGKISFSFYLLHLSMMNVVVYVTHSFLDLWVMKIVIFILTTIVSYCSYVWVEKKFITVGRKIILINEFELSKISVR